MNRIERERKRKRERGTERQSDRARERKPGEKESLADNVQLMMEQMEGIIQSCPITRLNVTTT